MKIHSFPRDGYTFYQLCLTTAVTQFYAILKGAALSKNENLFFLAPVQTKRMQPN